jgi:hypothetical protein
MLGLSLALAFVVPTADEIAWDAPSFKIPIEYLPGRKDEIRKMELHVSADRGTTWARHSVAQPGQTDFVFRAKRDGPYWFVLVIEDNKGDREPSDMKKAEPGVKMYVRVKRQ